MKHTPKITLILVAFFFAAQLLGLFTVSRYIEIEKGPDGTVILEHRPTALGEQPEIPDEHKPGMAVAIVVMILIGTGLLFVLIRFRLTSVWKYWYLIAIAATLSVFFGVYMPALPALGIGIALGLLRVFRPGPYVHNATEIFIYTGMTILILPLLNLVSAGILLVLISLYDMFAVWKSKHMIKMAKFQLKSRLFAGFAVRYGASEIDTKSDKSDKSEPGNAILGGGDIAFPLFFASAVMERFLLQGAGKAESLAASLPVAAGAGIALLILLLKGQKGKFYPAMPFITLGCFAGYLATML